ncbi:MAG TPA: tRNA preQ1(34) S-adenosylmethionine ribosyltransferase-isomerase QueA [Acholeplasmataceae bacterium]|jgi:S-adenosylmethionine:tRNA ribosyltransferase-isomerase|nr:tRNA preQ1(34) S-adenosylmethionine ribosyltransferase-isomerase QueA [Acholeplasmataceae bacterium]
MKLEDFDYYLPENLIAQKPIDKRSHSRLMIVDRYTEKLEHKHFYDIIDYLDENDVLVLNDTKVMPSRIYGTKVDTKASIEFLLLKEVEPDTFEALVKPARRVRVGTEINFQNIMKGIVIKKEDEGICHIKFSYQGIFLERLEELGEMPLPPYIHEKLEDKERYQTVYAKIVGSAAAPTAGLHFTEELLQKLKDKGVEIYYCTLHVGLGTFRPVNVEEIEKHKMHAEYFILDQKTADALNRAKTEGKRIISVGTTSTRTLESIYTKYNKFVGTAEETSIFIYPGYKFKAIDGLITNFHLPKSTLIMLVSAFASREIILNSYKVAIEKNYRFFSFGDAMFIK